MTTDRDREIWRLRFDAFYEIEKLLNDTNHVLCSDDGTINSDNERMQQTFAKILAIIHNEDDDERRIDEIYE